MSVGVASGLAAWAVGHRGDVVLAGVAVPVTVGVLLLVGAVVLGRPRLVAPSIALVGLGYALSRFGRPVDAGAAWYGALLLVVAELAFWSLDLRFTGAGPPGGHRSRWMLIAGATAASAVLGGAVLISGASSKGGAGWEVTAGVAAVAVLGLVAGLARNSHRPGARRDS